MAEEQKLEDSILSARTFQPGNDIDLDAIQDVPIEISVVLGQTTLSISEILKLGKGAIFELDKKVGEPVDLFVNGRCVARGEVVIVDENIGVTMTEIIKNDKE
jgi:flagellar motor switch protein FliN/FliY